jgi:hypothetical protein
VQGDPVRREPHVARQGELAGRADVEEQALVVDDAGDRAGE